MQIGVLAAKKDRRAILVPDSIKRLIRAGHQVWVEKKLGDQSFLSDADYEAAGAEIKARKDIVSQSELIIGLELDAEKVLVQVGGGKSILSLFSPAEAEKCKTHIPDGQVHVYNLSQIPRTTLAQSMDVRSSMASLAGYKAVLIAASHLPAYFPMLMTAAGTIPPARVLVLGAGVAGLQAIATARRLGARVEAFDVRTAAREEVESLGATFVVVEGSTEDLEAGGYAVEQTEDYKKRQKELIHERIKAANVVITTANIPGRKAPILIEEASVEAMQAGSVIVDLAAENGGNCVLTQDQKSIVAHGVTIIGDSDLATSLTRDASRLLSNNIYHFINHVFREGGPDFEDEIVKGTLI